MGTRMSKELRIVARNIRDYQAGNISEEVRPRIKKSLRLQCSLIRNFVRMVRLSQKNEGAARMLIANGLIDREEIDFFSQKEHMVSLRSQIREFRAALKKPIGQ